LFPVAGRSLRIGDSTPKRWPHTCSTRSGC